MNLNLYLNGNLFFFLHKNNKFEIQKIIKKLQKLIKKQFLFSNKQIKKKIQQKLTIGNRLQVPVVKLISIALCR